MLLLGQIAGRMGTGRRDVLLMPTRRRCQYHSVSTPVLTRRYWSTDTMVPGSWIVSLRIGRRYPCVVVVGMLAHRSPSPCSSADSAFCPQSTVPLSSADSAFALSRSNRAALHSGRRGSLPVCLPSGGQRGRFPALPGRGSILRAGRRNTRCGRTSISVRT